MTSDLSHDFNEVARGTLVIFRHGETEYNAKKWMTGQHDAKMTPDGREEARDAGVLMTGMEFDAVYGSTLSRSFETAAISLDASGSNDHLRNNDGSWRIQKDKRLMESDTGTFTGRNYKTDPEILAFKATQSAYAVRLPGGESDKDVTERVAEFYRQEILPRMQRGETVMLVGHASVLLAFDIVLGIAPEPKDNEKVDRKSVEAAFPMAYQFENGNLSYFHPVSAPPAPEARVAASPRPHAAKHLH